MYFRAYYNAIYSRTKVLQKQVSSGSILITQSGK